MNCWYLQINFSFKVNAVEAQTEIRITGDNYALGIIAVLLTCVTAGFAGKYQVIFLFDYVVISC